MKLKIMTIEGKASGKSVELNPAVFEIEPNDHVIYLAVKSYLNNQRQGNHATKNRTEVSGGGGKPFRQKGTGRARQGTIRSPLMVGGGRAFGPIPRDYRQDLPKKVKKLARKSALSYKAKENKIIVIEDFKFDEPKTRQVADILQKLNIDTSKVLIITSENDINLYKSARNIPYTRVQKSPDFSTYEILNSDVLIFQKGALEKVNEVLA
ncbi:MAG: 50S ribosomal protein L4 [Calditrichia bacterium]